MSSLGFSQVGIGTITPQEELHVAGDFLIQTGFTTGSYPTVTNSDENFKFLARSSNSLPAGEVKVLDTETLNVAPINIFEYEFINLNLDNLRDVDLQFNSTDYIVSTANFRYEGNSIPKRAGSNGRREIGYFVKRTYVDPNTNTWHLEIRNRVLDSDNSTPISYKVTLIVYDTSYFKNLPLIDTDLNGNNSGTASNTPILN